MLPVVKMSRDSPGLCQANLISIQLPRTQVTGWYSIKTSPYAQHIIKAVEPIQTHINEFTAALWTKYRGLSEASLRQLILFRPRGVRACVECTTSRLNPEEKL